MLLQLGGNGHDGLLNQFGIKMQVVGFSIADYLNIFGQAQQVAGYLFVVHVKLYMMQVIIDDDLILLVLCMEMQGIVRLKQEVCIINGYGLLSLIVGLSCWIDVVPMLLAGWSCFAACGHVVMHWIVAEC